MVTKISYGILRTFQQNQQTESESNSIEFTGKRKMKPFNCWDVYNTTCTRITLTRNTKLGWFTTSKTTLLLIVWHGKFLQFMFHWIPDYFILIYVHFVSSHLLWIQTTHIEFMLVVMSLESLAIHYKLNIIEDARNLYVIDFL